MRLTVRHTTRFQYAMAPSYGLLQVRMVPQTHPTQKVLDWELALSGAKRQAMFTDQHGNLVDLIEVLPDADGVELEVSGTVESLSNDGVFGRHTLAMPLWFYLRPTPLTRPSAALADLAETIAAEPDNMLANLHTLSERIRDAVDYVPGATAVTTSAADAMAKGQGVCQDHTHIFLSVARQLGRPARYVGGYLLMDDAVDQDASHAWAEVHIDGLGWVGFDVSNGISPDQRYVRVAQGLDYADVAPTRGITKGAQQENLIVSIQVQQ
ncbi:MAG: transglutaminase family protein [Pseudomonadota bacterium]